MYLSEVDSPELLTRSVIFFLITNSWLLSYRFLFRLGLSRKEETRSLLPTCKLLEIPKIRWTTKVLQHGGNLHPGGRCKLMWIYCCLLPMLENNFMILAVMVTAEVKLKWRFSFTDLHSRPRLGRSPVRGSPLPLRHGPLAPLWLRQADRHVLRQVLAGLAGRRGRNPRQHQSQQNVRARPSLH